MIRKWYNQIPYPALKIKREITKYINWQQVTKGTRGKPIEQLFPRQVVIQAGSLELLVSYRFFVWAPLGSSQVQANCGYSVFSGISCCRPSNNCLDSKRVK